MNALLIALALAIAPAQAWAPVEAQPIPTIYPPERSQSAAESNALMEEGFSDLRVMLLRGKLRKELESDNPDWARIERIEARIDEVRGISPAERAQIRSLQARAVSDEQEAFHAERIAAAEARRKEAEARIAEIKAIKAERELAELEARFDD